MKAVLRGFAVRLSVDCAIIRRFLRRHLPSDLDGWSCDLGCGRTPHRQALAGHARRLRFLAIDHQAMTGVDLVADMELLPLPDCSMTLVTCFESLQFVRDPAAVLAEAWRVLAPGGRLVLAYPFLYADGPDHTFTRWTTAGAAGMVEAAGFVVSAEAPRGGTLVFLCHLLSSLSQRLVPGWRRVRQCRWRGVLATLLWLPWQVVGRGAAIIDAFLPRPSFYVGGILLARKPPLPEAR